MNNELEKTLKSIPDSYREVDFELQQIQEVVSDHSKEVIQIMDDIIAFVDGNGQFPTSIKDIEMNIGALLSHLKDYMELKKIHTHLQSTVKLLEEREKRNDEES